MELIEVSVVKFVSVFGNGVVLDEGITVCVMDSVLDFFLMFCVDCDG